MAQTYLLNCWYGLAWAEELDSGRPLPRTALGKKLVVFRDADGQARALLDRCPHRFAPLSLGSVDAGVLRCMYHGLGFGGNGQCVSNPQGAIPERATVRAFPVVERHHMLWFWPGDPDLADPSGIPDFSFQDQSTEDDWVIFGYTHVETDYQNETDNLMDLSHAEFLHVNTFGGGDPNGIHRGELQVSTRGDEIHSNWWKPGVPALDPATRRPTGDKLDMFLDMRWNAPCVMRLHLGFLPHGQHDRKETDREDLPGQFTAHIITPEEDGTCHYFWSGDRPKGPGPFVGGIDAVRGRVFFKAAFETEDKPMVEAVEANMTTNFWDERPVILPNDAAGIRARRRLAKLISDEQAALHATDPTPSTTTKAAAA